MTFEQIAQGGRGKKPPCSLALSLTLAVHIEWAHTHITQNPVAVNTQCWPARRARGKIYPNGKVEYGF